MKTDWNRMRVGQIVARFPRASEPFIEFAIDYCCGGAKILGDVIQAQDLDGEAVRAALDRIEAESLAAAARASADGAGEADFRAMSPADLADWIESRHHGPLREVMAEVGELIPRLLAAHGANHPELFRVHRVFNALRTELEQHLVREEEILFPAWQTPRPGRPVPAEDPALRALSDELRREHEAAGALLRDLREAAGGYKVPDDGCSTYRRTYRLLDAMEVDLHQHIHLENNILFPPPGGT